MFQSGRGPDRGKLGLEPPRLGRPAGRLGTYAPVARTDRRRERTLAPTGRVGPSVPATTAAPIAQTLRPEGYSAGPRLAQKSLALASLPAVPLHPPPRLLRQTPASP